MRVAFFDFDGTLTRRDSLMPFLSYVVGKKRFILGMVRLSPTLLRDVSRFACNDRAKEKLVRYFLAGFPLEQLRALGEAFASDHLPKLLRAAMMERLQWHQNQEHACVLVSASLDIYLRPWAEQARFSDVLCSRLRVDPGGVVDGTLDGANCFGAEKACRIREWMAGQQLDYVYAYGDSCGDREMLALANEGYLIRDYLNLA